MHEAPSSSRAWRASLDGLALVAVLLLGLASLPLPFGRDQGLYYYVAREWARRGAIPYRDVFDHKPPGIYVLHRLAIQIFGEVQWGIRVLDLAAVLASGAIAARLATPVGTKVERRTLATSLLLAAVLFYGVLNYWDSAQSEIYYAALGFGAVACALHVKRSAAAGVAAGLLSGLAVVVKPPVVWLVLVAVVLLGRRARREGKLVITGVAFGAASALPIAATLAYFGAQHALSAMVDVVVGANGYYVTHEHDPHPVLDGLDGTQGYLAYYAPFSTLLIFGGALVTWLDRGANRRQLGFAWLLVLAAFCAMAMQMKFYLLHWTPMVVALAVLGTLLLARLEAVAPRARGLAPLLVLSIWLLSVQGRRWVELQMGTVRWLSGHDSRERWAGRFQFPEIGFSYADSEWVGLWLREHTAPDEPVTVRGFAPEVYAVAGRRHPGRFFWTTFLTAPARAYRRDEYLAEDLLAFQGASRPRFVVANREALPDRADSAAYFAPLGYRPEVEHGRFVILRDTTRP